MALSEEDLVAAVRKQVRFISNSGILVQQGDLDEAVRIAVALRVLLHDTQRSHSLLGQLGWKDTLSWVNSIRRLEIAPGIATSLVSTDGELVGESFGLIVLQHTADGGLKYAAPLDRDQVVATLPFKDWWLDKALHSDGGPQFSRWDLVADMANRDGGAHVDPNGTSEAYATFKLKGAGTMWIEMPAGQEWPPPNLDLNSFQFPGDAASPSVLQIGWEVIETLRRASRI